MKQEGAMLVSIDEELHGTSVQGNHLLSPHTAVHPPPINKYTSLVCRHLQQDCEELHSNHRCDQMKGKSFSNTFFLT